MQAMSMSVPALNVINGRPTALSTQVAEFFGKLHRHVMRDIRSLIDSAPECQSNFGLTSYKDCQGKEQPAYRMDRKGFVLLAMGFTGEQALKFKIAYIDAFDKMEAQLRGDNLYQSSTLTPAQQLLVRQAVASRAKIESKNYQTIYRAIYNRFQIARYDQLPQTDLNECLKFIQEVNLNTPEVKHHSEPAVQGQVLLLTHEDCERLRNFIYAFKYLFRKEVEMFFEFLHRVKSPYAGKFYDATTDWSLTNVEQILEKCGYPVKELDCYKHWASHM